MNPCEAVFQKRDLRTREGRMLCVQDSVSCGECMLPSSARLLVLCLAFAAYEREQITIDNLLRWMSQRSPRTVRKYLSLVQEACGEDPIQFIRDVVEGHRPSAEWFRALELHGGRHGG